MRPLACHNLFETENAPVVNLVVVSIGILALAVVSLRQRSVSLCDQKGLIRTPDPVGENGVHFAHIIASLRASVDRPSSKKKGGPW